MTAQEQQMLQGLVDRINQTQLPEKDVDAEQLIQQTLGRNPDSLYVMAQTVLVQQYALDQAQKQVVDLRGQLDQTRRQAQEPKHSTSFLGNLLGHHDDPAHAVPPPPPPAQSQYASPGYGPGLAYPSGGYPIPGAPQQGGGFLRSAMQTATGVAAGALAFEGIETLMHGFGHAAGYGTEFSGAGSGVAGLGGARPEEIINNNYYGGDSPHEHVANTSSGVQDRRNDFSDGNADTSQVDKAAGTNGDGKFQDASYVNAGDSSGGETDADTLSGTSDTDYSSQGDDSMLSDDVGDQGGDGGSDSGSDDAGGGFDGADSSSF